LLLLCTTEGVTLSALLYRMAGRQAPVSQRGCPDGEGLPHPQTRVGPIVPSGERKDDDYDVLADGAEDRTPTHGYAVTREAAMADFAKSWRRE